MNAIHFNTQLKRFPMQETSAIADDDMGYDEWLIPLRCNVWIQLAYALLVLEPICLTLFLVFDLDVLLNLTFFSLAAATFLLVITFGGKHTLLAYQRARSHIRKHGRFDKRLQHEFMKQKYCLRAGARAAARDLGVSRDLLPALANAWRII